MNSPPSKQNNANHKGDLVTCWIIPPTVHARALKENEVRYTRILGNAKRLLMIPFIHLVLQNRKKRCVVFYVTATRHDSLDENDDDTNNQTLRYAISTYLPTLPIFLPWWLPRRIHNDKETYQENHQVISIINFGHSWLDPFMSPLLSA